MQDRTWVDGTLGLVGGAGLDGLAFVSDPVGVLLQYGIVGLIEHVKPLSEALDRLAGDPGAIAGTRRPGATSRRVRVGIPGDARTYPFEGGPEGQPEIELIPEA